MRPSHAILLGAALLVFQAPDSARADTPPFPNHITPACIRLVASNGAAPASAFGQFEVLIRDLANNPMPDVSVVIDLSWIPELALATDQLDPDVVLNCGFGTVGKISDVNGRVVFCIVGGGRAGVPPSALLGAGRIYANGTLIATPTVSAFDLDGLHGLGAGDLTQFLNDFSTGVNYGRSDYDCSDYLGAGDLVIWLTAFSSGTQVVSAAVCP